MKSGQKRKPMHNRKPARMATALLGTALIATWAAPGAPARADEPDALLTTPVTPQILAKGNEIDAYTLGVQAYVWGYPLLRMERVARQYSTVPADNPPTSYRATLNHIGWARELATPAAKDMPTANNDTFYMSAVVKLDEPFILSVPDTHDRYYFVDVFNMWQELQHYIGRRTTGTKAAHYAIVPPGWTGALPPGVTRLDVSTGKVWLWGRLRVSPGENIAPLHALQSQFRLVPLSLYGKAHEAPETAALPKLPAIDGDELGFFKQLAAALKENTIKPEDRALVGQFSRIGLGPDGFDAAHLSPERRRGLVRALADGPMAAVSAFSSAAVVRNGWSWATGLDDFGFNYTLRALVAGPYLGGQGEKEAMYPLRYADSSGQVLTGAHTYTLKFSARPPVDAFWSVTAYRACDKLLAENPIGRYKIGDDTPGLVTAPDGSITLRLQHTDPGQAANANWLPTPEGPFYLVLRLYQPASAILQGTYQLPEVNRTE
jgi:hypothetical protein